LSLWGRRPSHLLLTAQQGGITFTPTQLKTTVFLVQRFQSSDSFVIFVAQIEQASMFQNFCQPELNASWKPSVEPLLDCVWACFDIRTASELPVCLKFTLPLQRL